MTETPLWVINYEGPTLTEDGWTYFRNPPKARPASPLEVLEAARQLEGAERVWRCQHGRGGEKLCREVNAYEPLLHADCGWTLVIPLGIEGEETP